MGEREINSLPGLKASERQRLCLSRETMEGLKITGKYNIVINSNILL